MRYKDETIVFEYLNVFQGILNQLVVMEMKMNDEIYTLYLIGLLLNSWDTFVVFLINSTLNSIFTLKMVKENMLNKENRRNTILWVSMVFVRIHLP